jgi:hypothetical protein
MMSASTLTAICSGFAGAAVVVVSVVDVGAVGGCGGGLGSLPQAARRMAAGMTTSPSFFMISSEDEGSF